MLDRVSTKPGRVLISPEDGKAAFYATMARADEPTQEGNPLNKATLLSDATAAMFGFGQEAVPDNVLAFLGKYAQHMWFRKASLSRLVQVAEEPVQIVAYDSTSAGGNTKRTIFNSIRVNTNGVACVNPATSLTVSYNYYDDILEWKGHYVQVDGSVYFVGDNATATRDKGGKGYRTLWSLNLVTIKDMPAEEVSTYLFSPDENAYPHSGEADGYDYYYIGKPLDQTIKEPLRFVRGYYTGTGVYGTANPNKLIFPFKKLLALFVVLADDGYSDSIKVVYFGQPGGSRLTFTENGNMLEWCYAGDTSTNGPSYQANIAETGYAYFAIGLDTDREEN